MDFSKCFKGKAIVSADIPHPVSAHTAPAPLPQPSVPNLPRAYIDKGKLLVSVDYGHSVFKPSALPSTDNSTLVMAIRSIGVALTPQPIAPHAPFFKEVVVDDCFWNSKGKRKLMEVNTEAIPPTGKKIALSVF
ncbi:hypothetical protein CJ030_MR7G027967 [Morella rubra]|uniref:Uncharacterized protein n=1 Tax=Morella rubra TaxID=262757 RepID=A0A6A1V1D7_9ROSI|nr:hypothetical protein CJ030_MR7G027967 [Morella rubra]